MSACKVPSFRVLVGLVFSLAALIVTSAPGQAVTLTNRDERDHKVTVVEGETKTDHVLKPNQVLEKICPKGCVVRLNDGDDDEYQLEVDDIVSIEEGYLYHDGPDAAPETPSPTAPQGGPQGTAPPAKK
ncbi:MAG: hypothetical protein ABL907_15715 [Hyphomicrobium sp.]